MATTYTVTVSILPSGDVENSDIIYQQTIESLNLRAVIEAVNHVPLKKRRAPRSDKGRKRVAVNIPYAA